MRVLTSVFVLMCCGGTAVGGQVAVAPSDSAVIFGAIANWDRAWEIHDAELASRDYTADADWTNAFGMRRIGRDSIQAFLTTVFDLPFVMAGSTEYEYHDLRMLADGVVALRSRAVRDGQQLPDGTVEEPRRINHLRVFVKRQGLWGIIAHLIGDERTPGEAR